MKNIFYLLTAVCALSFASCSDDDDENLESITVTTSEVETFNATITFSEIEEALYYDVELSEDAGATFEYIESIDSTSELTYELDDLLAGSAYEVKVIAYSSYTSETEVGEGTVEFSTTEALTDLIGTWTRTSGDYSYSYTFNEDGTGVYDDAGDETIIKWVAEESVDYEEAEITIYKYSGDDYTSGYYSITYAYTYYAEDGAIELGGNEYLLEVE